MVLAEDLGDEGINSGAVGHGLACSDNGRAAALKDWP